MARLLKLLLAVAAFAGCALDHHGYLIKTGTDQQSTVIFHDKPSGHNGSAEAVLANGEKCQGRFNTIPDIVTRNWEDWSDIESEDTQIGVAVLQCKDHHTVRCDFSRERVGSGSGHCSDNQGQKYSLSF